ncbi:MAG: STAS domain-containing protein, partial [Marinobacter sp.]
MSTNLPEVSLDGNTLSVRGEIDPLSVVPVRREGEKSIQASKADLQVDLSAMGTAHSVVLSLLLCWQRFACARSQSLRFIGVSDRLNS